MSAKNMVIGLCSLILLGVIWYALKYFDICPVSCKTASQQISKRWHAAMGVVQEKIAKLYHKRDIKDELGKEILALMTERLSTTQDEIKRNVSEQLRQLAVRIQHIDRAQQSLDDFGDTIGMQIADLKGVGDKEYQQVKNKTKLIDHKIQNVEKKLAASEKKATKTHADLRLLYEQSRASEEQTKLLFEKTAQGEKHIKKELSTAQTQLKKLQKNLAELRTMKKSVMDHGRQLHSVEEQVEKLRPLTRNIARTEGHIKHMNRKIEELVSLQDLLLQEKKERIAVQQKIQQAFDAKLANSQDTIRAYINDEVSRMALELARNDQKIEHEGKKVRKYIQADLEKMTNQMKSHEQVQEKHMVQMRKEVEHKVGKQVDNVSKELRERLDARMREYEKQLQKSSHLAAESAKEQLREEMKLIASQWNERIADLAASQEAIQAANEPVRPPTEIKKIVAQEKKPVVDINTDAIIKKEVRKQLAKIKYAKDVKSKNLRKLLAQKKMKKLLNSFLQNDLEDVDF